MSGNAGLWPNIGRGLREGSDESKSFSRVRCAEDLLTIRDRGGTYR